MLLVPDLRLGSIDAINYQQRDQKDFLSRVFYKDHFLEDILKSHTYFILGEKGTGKTAYATFATNTDYGETKGTIKTLDSTDYQKFVQLKQQGQKLFSNYEDIWKVILLLLASYHLSDGEPIEIFNMGRFRPLRDAIEEYYRNAFAPEIAYALEFVENSEANAALISKYIKMGLKVSEAVKENVQGLQTSLHYIQRQFEDAIRSLKLRRNHILFIDGIDIRPSGIPFDTYIECLKGLAKAAWDLNTSFFANVKDSKGRVKIILLVRPDIFAQLGYQNANAKVRDNAVILDWRTTYQDYRTSRIFRLMDGILSKQENSQLGDTTPGWDFYFNYALTHLYLGEREDDAFIGLLRYSFHRPRDIISYLLSMQSYVSLHERDKLHFSKKSFYSCQSEYSDYLLGEVRDYLLFYFSNVDFNELTGFFTYMKGRNTFTWDFFCKQYQTYMSSVDVDKITIRELKTGPEEFLQLLYSLNVVAYRETTDDDEAFVHWCFRDRTPTVLNPKVILGGSYHTHAGLQRSLKVGGSPSGRAGAGAAYRRPRQSNSPRSDW